MRYSERCPAHVVLPISLQFLAATLAVCQVFASTPTEPKPAPPASVRETAKTLPGFQLEKGFWIELVASEPAVEAPVAMAFDENGRLFIAEIPGYAAGQAAAPQLGRIRVLEDIENEGKFGQSTVYADQVPSPSAVACYGGGVFVAAAPEILYLKDTRGGGNANVRTVAFTGLGDGRASSLQGLPNSFTWGLDNRIHALVAGIAGTVKPAGPGEAEPLLLADNDFSFNPRTLALWPETGSAHSGLSFDSFGRKFVSDFARPLMLPAYPVRYAWRNPFYVQPPGLRDVLSPATTIFHSAPAEEAGTSPAPPRASREPALTPGTQTNMLAATWLTNAIGSLVYRGSAFPPNYSQNVFIPDPQAHVIHRVVLREQGLQVLAERPRDEKGTEFLVSTDPSFRPMQVVMGPEGALYVADMNSGGGRGRIYRIVPENFKPPQAARLGNAPISELIVALASPNGWHSDMAARLLVQRRDSETVPLLYNMLNRSKVPLVRLRALHVLDGLGALKEEYVLKGLKDPDERVRQQALELVERVGQPGQLSPGLRDQLQAMVADPSVRVRYQLAFALATLRVPDRVPPLCALLKRDLNDEWFRAAVLSSLPDGAGAMVVRAASDPQIRGTPAGLQFLSQLVTMIGVQGHVEEVTPTIEFLARGALNPQLSFALVAALGDGLRRARSGLALTDRGNQLQTLYLQALKAISDNTVAWPLRTEAIRMLGVANYAYTNIVDWLLLMLSPTEVPVVQMAAVETLARFPDPRAAFDLSQRLSGLAPALRTEAVGVLLTRVDRAPLVLAALQDGRIAPSNLTASQVDWLRAYPEPNIRERALQLFGPPLVRRPDVVERFRPALKLNGAASQGRAIFQARCAACHRLAGQGSTFGPDLTGARTRSKEGVLKAILEPNLVLTPGYSACVIESVQGDSSMGLQSHQTPTTLTLRQPNGAAAVWPLTHLHSVQTVSVSLMPVGLEAGLNTRSMADLLAYIVGNPK